MDVQVYLVAVMLAIVPLVMPGPGTSDDKINELWNRLDADADGTVSEKELKSYAVWERSKELREDLGYQWDTYGLAPGEKLTFEQYKEKTFSFDDDDETGPFGRTIKQDRRRFDASDKNKDGVLDRDVEFFTFMWAEEFPHMHDLVIQETIEDLDKDGDGRISYKEYTAEGLEESQFAKFDRDNDRMLNPAETKAWVLESTLDEFKEDDRLVRDAMAKLDTDKDGTLSRAEVEADPKVLSEFSYDDDDDEWIHDEF